MWRKMMEFIEFKEFVGVGEFKEVITPIPMKLVKVVGKM